MALDTIQHFELYSLMPPPFFILALISFLYYFKTIPLNIMLISRAGEKGPYTLLKNSASADDP